MNTRETRRRERLREILKNLKSVEDRVIDKKKLIYHIMFQYGITRRTAKEYIDVVMANL